MVQQSSSDGIMSLFTSPEIKISMVTFIVSAMAIKLIQSLMSNNKPPPGPRGFPILGHLPLLGKDITVTFANMRKTFGDVFSIRLGSWPAVVINGRKAIREALQGDACSGRPQFYTATLTETISGGESISFGVFDQQYIRHRKVGRQVLTAFTNAKTNPMEEILHREVDTLLEIFAARKEEPFYPHDDMLLGAGSIIYQICYGRHESIRENKDFTAFILRSKKFTEFAAAGNPADIFPWLRHIIPWKVNPVINLITESIHERFKKVDEHRQSFDSEHLRDVTDGFIKLANGNSEDAEVLGKERLFTTIDDFFGAGFGTVATTMEWAMKLMASNPDIQTKIQQEIDDVVGSSRRPSLEDRGKMLYTEATIHEIMRFSSLAPLALPHYTTEDMTINGYNIRKGTVVFINLFSMSRDPEVWHDPDVFRPDRFLDTSGNIKKSLLEEFLPFGAGRRKCIGEFLGRMEIFLFFTGLLQRCSIFKPTGVTYDMGVTIRLTRDPNPFEVKIVMRT